jgi:hypothetical protein
MLRVLHLMKTHSIAILFPARRHSQFCTRMMADEEAASEAAEEEAKAPANRKARRDAEKAQKKGSSE